MCQVPKQVHVTAWGCPLEQSNQTLIYFGGMPASATHEIPLHSLAAVKDHVSGEKVFPTNTMTSIPDFYLDRKVHLLTVDKPGMGKTPLPGYQYSLTRDWPVIVRYILDHYELSNSKTGIFGVSNGGPYVMACLTHPITSPYIHAAANIVGVSDVWASGYFSVSKHPSGFVEGLYNSLPIAVTGPINNILFRVARLYLNRLGGYDSLVNEFKLTDPKLIQEVKTGIDNVIADGVLVNAGLGSAVDCQQGLSPVYSRSNIADEYKKVSVPVALWYGGKDSSVSIGSAGWLHDTLPYSTLKIVSDAGHGLLFYHIHRVVDDLIEKVHEGTRPAVS